MSDPTPPGTSPHMRKHTRRGLARTSALGAGSAAFGLVAAACAPGGSAPPASTKEPVTLTLSTDWNTGPRGEAVKHWIQKAPELNRGIKLVEQWSVQTQEGGGTVAGNVAVQTAIAAGTGPDVAMELWPNNPPAMLMGLDDHMKQRRLSKTDYFWQKYEQETPDGKAFAIPLGTYFGAFAANLDLFQQVGLRVPGKDWTFNDLRDLASRLKVGRAWGFERQLQRNGQGWVERFASEGADWYDSSGRTVLNVGKDGGKPEEMFADWWGYVWRDRLAPNAEEIAEVRRQAGITNSAILFSSGLIGISGFRPYQAGTARAAIADKFRYQILWPPKSVYSGRRGYFSISSGIAVTKSAAERKHPDEAADLAFTWLGDAMQEYVATTLPVFPAARKFYKHKAILDIAPGAEQLGEMADEAQKLGASTTRWRSSPYSHPRAAQWYALVESKIHKQALVDGGDPRVALREAVAEGTRILS